MSISSAGTDWRAALDAGGQSLDDRFYFDPRGFDYPDIARDTRNYMDRGDCESATTPAIRGEVGGAFSNTSAVRSTLQAHGGLSSFLITKEVAVSTTAFWYPQDAVDPNDMHGFLPGETVEHLAWVYIPTSGGPSAAEVSISILEYYSAAWHILATATASVLDSFEKLAIRGTLNDSTTGFAIRYGFASTAEDEEFFYVDDLDSRRYASFTLAREDNLIDRGNCESTTLPGILGETGTLFDATGARSGDFSRSGDYSIKIVSTTNGVSIFNFADSGSVAPTDMHGLVAGDTNEVSVWVYVPTASGLAVDELYLYLTYYDAATTAWVPTRVDVVGSLDAWVEVSSSWDIATTASGAYFYIASDPTTLIGEYFYFDDARASRHSVPGSHYLSGGYTEHLVTLPDTGTIQIKFKANFAFDVATNQHVMSWRVSATQYFLIYYPPASAKFTVIWFDGGTLRSLTSAQYDDGTAHRNINQWITETIAFDLTTGDTTGSSLWMDKVLDDTSWSGNLDAKTTTLNKMQIRAWDSLPKDYDIAYVRMFPDYVATDADVQNDFKDVLAEEIFFPFDDHATGKTRCKVSAERIFSMSYEKGIENRQSGAYSSNTYSVALKNNSGEFSDDQNAAFDPLNEVYNGTDEQNYLQRRCRVWAENWYGGDFDYTFVGRLTGAGFSRQTTYRDLSYVTVSARDMVERFHTRRFRYGKHWEDVELAAIIESNSLIHLLAREARPRLKQYLAGNSWEIDGDKGDQWTASGGTYTTQTNPLFGARCGRLVPGGLSENLSGLVTFTGTEKLSVGQTFTFYVWVLSSAGATGAANYIQIAEQDVGGNNSFTIDYYTLAGGEGYVRVSVSHTITDSDSDRLLVVVGADAGDTIDMDGAMLIPGDRASNLFRDSSLTLNDAASGGSVSADQADEVEYNIFGFDVRSVSITHPWKRVEQDESAWSYLTSVADATAALYIGDDTNGTLKFRAILEDDYSDDVPAYEFGETDAKPGINTNLTRARTNKIVGRGVKIIKDKNRKHLVTLEDSRSFDLDETGKYLDVTVANGADFPEPDEYGVYWARYDGSRPAPPPEEEDLAEPPGAGGIFDFSTSDWIL